MLLSTDAIETLDNARSNDTSDAGLKLALAVSRIEHLAMKLKSGFTDANSLGAA